MPEPSFSPELFDFLSELADNNDREWFQANKERYEDDVVDPALRFISDIGPGLAEISPHIQALPKRVGGSMFRIYRDVRFSKDKSPYKTHVGIHFRHKQAKDAHAPGFYLHLEPGGVFMGSGIWHPPSAVIQKIRQSMLDDPAAWEKTRDEPAFRGPLKMGGESLKRPPRGVSKDHPLIEDLKRKDLLVSTELDDADVLSPGFRDQFLDLCRQASPLTAWICRALDAPF